MSKHLTPAEIVLELDKYIIGQDAAKRAVAIALRNRWRRQQVEGELREEIYPNNIILIGPTGVGKTELARRLANLAGAPFIKVEASKYTEVGYVGRDVESMIRDLLDAAVSRVKTEHRDALRDAVEHAVVERLLDLLVPTTRSRRQRDDGDMGRRSRRLEQDRRRRRRERIRIELLAGLLEQQTVEFDVPEDSLPIMQVFSSQGIEEMGINIPDMMGGQEKRTRRRKVTIAEARDFITEEEMERQVEMDRVIREAVRRTETAGIVFLDEIDKIAAPADSHDGGPDVSRSGVQRDILPVVEGTTVTTKYGIVRTDHILFIAAGAFTAAKPSDLIPELQGRFPIRVELEKLGADEFFRILTEPRNALVRQYTALLATEGVTLTFTRDALKEIAATAHRVNQRTEDIGARRLHTLMTTLLDDILFEAPNLKQKKISITRTRVQKTLEHIAEDEDLARFIL
ncbi:ATP-dependent protease ATPase subunit HslU [candidate division KSB1 bacterium]|nr:MAG: ATP-dependent protease ATPase subunit HslU [candidate division KSB1 bacterium]